MHKPTILFFITAIFIFLNCASNKQKPDVDKEEWLELFDGVSMNNWVPKVVGHAAGVNHKNVWVVEDSLLKVTYAPTDSFIGQFGHLFYNEKFSHYRLKSTYRFVGEQLKGGPGWAIRNNGLMLHCQSPESMEINQDFPLSLEMQLLGGNGTDERNTGNLCTPATHVHFADTLFTPHCVNSTSKTYHGDQWVDVEVLVLGDSLFQHIVEGDLVMTYTKPVADLPDTPYDGQPVKDGYISIQSETAPIHFKNISLLNLCGCMDPKAKNYKSYFIKDDKASCVY